MIAALFQAGPDGVDKVGRDGERREAPLLSQLCPQVPPRIPGVPGIVGILISVKVT